MKRASLTHSQRGKVALFSYDVLDKLAGVNGPLTNAWAYTYDAFNRRASSTEGTATVFFHYGGASSRGIAETAMSGHMSSRHHGRRSAQL